MTDARPASARVAIALGGNLGDRTGYLRQALGQLSASVADLRASSFHETAPMGVVDPQPNYLNAAAVGFTRLTPGALIAGMLAIERQLGRLRPHANAARTIDLDLILYDDLVLDEPGLQLPHPRFRDRRFVLAPLAEIAPDMRDPVTGLTVAELLERMGGT